MNPKDRVVHHGVVVEHGKEMMTQEEKNLVNPNTADLETLMTLPGVGESMAQRILEARPLIDSEDMLRISGLGPASLARLEPYLTFDAEGVESSDEQVSKTATPEDGRQPKVVTRPKRTRRQTQSITEQLVSILQGNFSLVIITASISVLLSVLLTLSILAGINGTLSVGNHASVRLVESDLSTLQIEVDDLTSRVDAINLRLKAIEGLSGRVLTVEDQFATLREDVSGSLDDVEELQTQVEALNTDIDSITQSVDRFDQFLQGLRQLILEALPFLETTNP